MRTKPSHPNLSCSRVPLPWSPARVLCGAAALALPLVPAPAPAAEDESTASRVHALVSFEFSDKYLTPRGMIVHNDGLTFQPLVLAFVNVYKSESFLRDFTLVGGVWNDFSSAGVSKQAPYNSEPKTSWVEIDPIAGISVGLGKLFTLSATYTAFNMQVLDIGTSQHLETKLAFDDTPYLKAFALHPYFLYWQELVGKATAAQVPYFVDPQGKNPGAPPDSSYYFELGVAPSYTFKDAAVKVELPCRVLLPSEDFYGEYYDDASTVGLWEIGVKASMPLKFMPKGYGSWSVYAGFRYMNFVDENLQGMQEFNAPGSAVDDTVQYYGGVSVFF